MSIPYKDYWIWPGVTTGVTHLPTGRFIPKDERNRDWKKFIEWKKQTGLEALPMLDNLNEQIQHQRSHVAFGRTAKMNEVLWMVDRHKQQTDLGGETSLTDQQYHELLQYVQALRDVTDALGSVFISWPEKPSFI